MLSVMFIGLLVLETNILTMYMEMAAILITLIIYIVFERAMTLIQRLGLLFCLYIYILKLVVVLVKRVPINGVIYWP